jgi:glyoxylase I family protein
MILGVHHPALSVPDLAKALEFYRDKLGFETVMEADLPDGIEMISAGMGIASSKYKVAMLRKGNSCIELFEFPDADVATPDRPVQKHGITHICLASDDYQADYEMLESAGVRFTGAPVGVAPGRWVYGRDPCGNIMELLEHDSASPRSLDFGS